MKSNNKILILDQANSTNSELMELAKSNPDLPQFYSVIALNQTAGRGQRGNSWFVSPYKNLTYSFLLRYAVEASKQYVISEYVACSILTTLALYLSPEQQEFLTIKWPNDIYYKDKKLAGILIEHSLRGIWVDYSVVGVGININEDNFPKELPNPISLKQITGQEYPIEEIHRSLMNISEQMQDFLSQGNYSKIHQRYMTHLYRRDGVYLYRDKQGLFLATIEEVQANGHIILKTKEGDKRIYSFKEVIFEC